MAIPFDGAPSLHPTCHICLSNLQSILCGPLDHANAITNPGTPCQHLCWLLTRFWALPCSLMFFLYQSNDRYIVAKQLGAAQKDAVNASNTNLGAIHLIFNRQEQLWPFQLSKPCKAKNLTTCKITGTTFNVPPDMGQAQWPESIDASYCRSCPDRAFRMLRQTLLIDRLKL